MSDILIDLASGVITATSGLWLLAILLRRWIPAIPRLGWFTALGIVIAVGILVGGFYVTFGGGQ